MGHADIRDMHAPINGFAHIINCERGYRDGTQRFHLNTGLPFKLARSFNINGVPGWICNEVHFNRRQSQRMTKRNQIRCLFSAHGR